MPRTIQCNKCGVILNLPAHVAAGRRLKCPRCTTRFVVSETDASSISTVPGMTDAALTSVDLEKRPLSSDDLPNATSEGDLRDTFDLPLSGGRDVDRGDAVSRPDTADAAALFADSGPSKRRLTAAEARAKARRCCHCGSGVPAGMSICPTCGTDQETGMRVGLEDDLAPPPPPRSQGPPLHVSIVGGLCGTAALILALVGAINSTRSQSDLENYAWLSVALVAAFSIFACVQFLRGKSNKPFLLALALGAALNLIGLVVIPILKPLVEDQATIVKEVKPQEVDDSNLAITSPEDRIDLDKVLLGIGVTLLYAVISLYITSPPVKKYLLQCRTDRGP